MQLGLFFGVLRRKAKSLGARLVRLYLLLLFVPVAGIGLYGHQYLQRAISTGAIESRLNEIGVRALTIDALLRHVHDDMLYLGQRVQAGARDPSDELTGFAASHPAYQAIGWMGLDRSVQGGHLSPALAQWVADDVFESFAGVSEGSIQFFPLSFTDESGSALLVMAMRLDESILLLEVSSTYLLQGLLPAPESYEWALMVQPDTYIMTASDLALFFDDTVVFNGASGYLPRGDRMTLFQSTGPGGNWLLLSSIPMVDVRPDLSGYYATFALLLVGGLVSAAGLALFGISRMVEPVYQLERMVDRLRQGGAPPSLPDPLPMDEFGKLILAFDQMAAELEQKRRSERALIEQIIRTQEEERKFIAYDLHDGLIQQLVGARFYLGQCRTRCPLHGDGVMRSYDVLTHAITEGRRIIQGLHPTVLEDLGLEAALEELLHDMAESGGWQVQMTSTPLDPEPDRATSVTLYRITQEALNNVFKHAAAAFVQVRLNVQEGLLCVCITDDGRGFDHNAALHNGTAGWGLKTMRERAAMLRGTFQVTSEPGAGTRVTVTIPYHAAVVTGESCA